MKYNDKLITELGAFFVDHGRYYGVDPVWHDHSKLVASDGAPDPALSADASGYLTAAVVPLFSAYNSVSDSNVTGDGTYYTVIFDTEIFDRNANYNNGTGVFTAPVTGKYLLVSAILITAVGVAHTTGIVRCSTSNRLYYSNYINPYGALSGIGFITLQFIAIVDMDATDTATIDIYVSGGAKTTGVYGAAGPSTYFQGYMLI